MTRKSFFVLFLLLESLAAKSQEPDPSWELSLNEATPYWDYMPMNLLELDDGNYLVPLVSTQEYQKSDERACEALSYRSLLEAHSSRQKEKKY